MRVFLSWAGRPSREVGESLRGWLPVVIQAVEPWMSSKDIDKGARWADEVSSELERSDFGILCITPGNKNAPWLLFEAGALSKKVGKSFVSPFLFGLEPSDLDGPLVQFQSTRANSEEIFRLVETINRAMGPSALSEQLLKRSFEKSWPDLEKELSKIKIAPSAPAPSRSDRELLEEMLELTREIAKQRPQALLLESDSVESYRPALKRELARLNRLRVQELLKIFDGKVESVEGGAVAPLRTA